MVHALFASMLGIAGVSTAVYSYYFDRKSLLPILTSVLFSLIALGSWFIAPVILLLAVFKNKMGFGMFAAFNIFSAILVSYFLLRLFNQVSMPYMMIAFFSVAMICLFAVLGMKQTRIREFLLISNAIYLLFALLNLSVGKIAGNPATLNHLHIFNYSIAGMCLFLSLGVFIGRKKLIHEFEGSFIENKWNSSFAVISCFSLAGLPAFNMFVSHWKIITTGFSFSPPLAILVIFASLLLIVMYSKMICSLLIGSGKKSNKPALVTLINAFLAFLIILLGLLPFIQNYLIKMVL